MNNNNIIIILFSVIIFTSCKTEKIELTGSISGSVKIFAEDGYFMPDAIANVSVLNTGFSVQTSTDGFYKLTDIPLGTYNINFDSDNSVSYTQRGVNITGGEKPYLSEDIVLGQKPVSVIDNLNVYTWGFGSNRIVGSINPPGTESNRKQIVLYVKDQNTVSKDNYDFFQNVVSVADTFYLEQINLYYNYPPEVTTLYLVAYTKSFQPEGNENYNFNCDEFNMNCEDFTISDTPSNIISVSINKK